jgi:hypothetical protein
MRVPLLLDRLRAVGKAIVSDRVVRSVRFQGLEVDPELAT